MNIIKRGNLPTDTPKRIVCNNCESVLEYTKRDTFSVNNYWNENPKELYYINCAVCQTRIYIDESTKI